MTCCAYSLKEFNKITTKLDEIRNQSFFKVYPEHINIKNYLIHNNLNDEFDYSKPKSNNGRKEII